MIIIDCGVFMRTCYQARKYFDQEKDQEIKENMIRNIIIKQIVEWRNKFHNTYKGEIVLADDVRGGSWRKDVFPYYKAKRGKNFTEKDKEFYSAIHKVKNEIGEIFKHWVYIQVEKCEGDDIVAVLTEKVVNDNNTDMFSGEKVLIISHDHDMEQLVRYGGVDFFNVSKNKIEKNITMQSIKENIITHIVKGDSGDGVPNIYSDDDTFVNPDKKQKSVTKKMLNEFFTKNLEDVIGDDEQLRRNFERNMKLVVLNKRPKEIKENILKEYEKRLQDKDKSGIMNYISEHRLIQLFEIISQI